SKEKNLYIRDVSHLFVNQNFFKTKDVILDLKNVDTVLVSHNISNIYNIDTSSVLFYGSSNNSWDDLSKYVKNIKVALPGGFNDYFDAGSSSFLTKKGPPNAPDNNSTDRFLVWQITDRNDIYGVQLATNYKLNSHLY